MTEATWSDDRPTAEIDWRMSASLENVPRGDSDVAEVTSLAGAVAEWQKLDPKHQAEALLTPERPLVIDGTTLVSLSGDAIGQLADRLPANDDVAGASGEKA